MKGPIRKTKVVLRHLPPTISQASLTEQIDGRFAGLYNWISFRHGNNNRKKHPSYSRGYIDFKRPEDVAEFAKFFDGRIFVNEKGSQFKTIVELAPSQRIPRQSSKRDGREGTINKDSEYMEFVEFISKPVVHLPSAEIQLLRREEERAGSAKDALIVTPLMDFVRQKRAATGGSGISLPKVKPTRTSGATSASPNSVSLTRGVAKRRISKTMLDMVRVNYIRVTTKATSLFLGICTNTGVWQCARHCMYVLRDTAKNTCVKDESTIILVPEQDDLQVSGNSVTCAAASGTEVLECENGVSGTTIIGKKKILPLRGKEKEIRHVSGYLSLQHNATYIKNSLGSTTLRPNHRCEASGRIVKSILLNNNTHQSPSLSSVVHSEQQIRPPIQEKDKRPPQPPNSQLLSEDNTNGHLDDKVAGNDLHGFCCEKRTRNTDRPNRGVWIPLQRSVGSHASELKQSLLDSAEGSHKHSGGCRGPAHIVKDCDSSSILNKGKTLKRGGSSGHSSHEKQVWVQNEVLLGLLSHWALCLLVSGNSFC
ncbi:hypothetical protein LguiB_006663 [Lonicera macranthoides]